MQAVPRAPTKLNRALAGNRVSRVKNWRRWAGCSLTGELVQYNWYIWLQSNMLFSCQVSCHIKCKSLIVEYRESQNNPFFLRLSWHNWVTNWLEDFVSKFFFLYRYLLNNASFKLIFNISASLSPKAWNLPTFKPIFLEYQHTVEITTLNIYYRLVPV